MKATPKTLTALLVFILCAAILAVMPLSANEEVKSVELNETNFPDSSFRSYLGKYDLNKDGVLSCKDVTLIDVNGNSVSDLTGIEYFTELRTLNCDSSGISSIDVSKNTKLQKLLLDNNSLTTLDLSANVNLKELYCRNNKLISLDLPPNVAIPTLEIGNQTIEITLDSDNKYTMPEGFNSSKVLECADGVFNDNILTVDFCADAVRYTYHTGLEGKELVVTLTFQNPNEHVFNETTHE